LNAAMIPRSNSTTCSRTEDGYERLTDFPYELA
jgi:hypothetical protein